MRTVKNILFQIPAYLLWSFLGVLLWGLVFAGLTDAPPERKVTLVTEVYECQSAALSVKLSESKPEGIRMVTVRPLSYFIIKQSEAEKADLFILPLEAAEAKRDLFLPLSAVGLESGDALCWDGAAYGIPLFDAAAGRERLTEYIRYLPEGAAPERFYLFFGVRSLHLGAENGCGDDAAVRVAETLLSLDGAGELPRPEEPTSGLPEGFLLGMDCSSLPAEEASGVRYYDFDGQERDLLEILSDAGLNCIRVRVWNDPYDGRGRGFGGGNCDVEKAAALGARAARYGLRLIVDFHYSDFWADPGKQAAPRAWQGMEPEEKAAALRSFTAESLNAIRKAGGEVAMVQLGNETNGALCGETDWDGVVRLMAAGAEAVRAQCPEALVAVHFTNPERAGAYADYAEQLSRRGLDYDVFASSYYPCWHGTPENLAQALGDVAERYGKRVMVMETSYAYTTEDSDFFGNTISADSAVRKPFPYTVQGQTDALREVIETVADIPGGIGVCYWEGAWISVGQKSWEENRALWEAHGSGWASSFAAAYDPEDAGRWYGGCAVDNQALFDPTGHPLETLKLFSALRQETEG